MAKDTHELKPLVPDVDIDTVRRYEPLASEAGEDGAPVDGAIGLPPQDVARRAIAISPRRISLPIPWSLVGANLRLRLRGRRLDGKKAVYLASRSLPSSSLRTRSQAAASLGL